MLDDYQDAQSHLQCTATERVSWMLQWSLRGDL